MGLIPDIGQVLRGMSGLAALSYFAGMLYFGYTLMRVRGGRSEAVFFWAVMSQCVGMALMAVASVAMMLFGYSMMGGGGVNWMGMMSSIMQGWVFLSSMVAALALVMSANGARH